MRILCIGDVVGSIGCEFLRNNLPTLKKVKGVDFVICNGENSADGNGLTPVSAKHLFDSGVDAITLGNHSFRRKEVYDCLDSNPFIVRPANFPENSTPGKGIINVDTGRRIVSIINIMGNSYMDNNLNCAFECVDKMIKQAESKIIIVDFTQRQRVKKGQWVITLTAEFPQCSEHTPMFKPRTHRFSRREPAT